MIKYKLDCKKCDKKFNSWFASSDEYEKLKKKNFVSCPFCNSIKVEKSLMSPNVINKKKNNLKNDNKYKKIKKKLKNIKNLLKIILTMLVIILHIRQGLFTIIKKIIKKEYTAMLLPMKLTT